VFLDKKDDLLLVSAHLLLSSEAFPAGSDLHNLLFAKECDCTMVCLQQENSNIEEEEVPVLLRIAGGHKSLLYDWIKLRSGSNRHGNEYLELINYLKAASSVKIIAAPVETKTWKWMTKCDTAKAYLDDFRPFRPSPLHTTQNREEPTLNLSTSPSSIIQTKTFARIGLMGNPSDGFFGKTLSMLISNFWAEVTLIPHHDSKDTRIVFERNYVLDPNVFESPQEISHVVGLDGYQGALVLFLALTRVFVSWCAENKVDLKSRGFRLFCSTNIPR
jgi:hypothetical protein